MSSLRCSSPLGGGGEKALSYAVPRCTSFLVLEPFFFLFLHSGGGFFFSLPFFFLRPFLFYMGRSGTWLGEAPAHFFGQRSSSWLVWFFFSFSYDVLSFLVASGRVQGPVEFLVARDRSTFLRPPCSSSPVSLFSVYFLSLLGSRFFFFDRGDCDLRPGRVPVRSRFCFLSTAVFPFPCSLPLFFPPITCHSISPESWSPSRLPPVPGET